jgi:hypothetical protein
MDRAMLERHLKQAKEHVALGRKSVLRQFEIIAELERDGHDATTARALLTTYQSIQEVQESDLDRIKKDLAALD